MTVPDVTTAGGNDTSRSSYEELRGRVLAGAADGRHFAVLLREGMAAWMAQRRSACSSPTNPVADVQRRGAEPFVSNEMSVSIVRVLASMAFRGREEMSA